MTEREAIDTLYEGLVGESSLSAKLRDGRGLDRATLARVKEACEALARMMEGRSEVPKRLALAFVDVQASMDVSRDAYPPDEQDAIEAAGMALAELGASLFDDEGGGEPPSPKRSSDLFRFVPKSKLGAVPKGALVYDVSSRAAPPFVKLSPFYPHGRVPVPGMPGRFSDSVEGVWQGLKVIEGAIDEACFTGKGKKRRGRPSGHRLGEELLGYVEARRRIYVPSYTYLWRECIGRDLRSLFFAAADRGEVQYFHDFDDNGDIEDTRSPLAHASVLVRLIAEEHAKG